MSAYINRIGEHSEYDSDMGICEDFVAALKQDPDAIRIVHNYYINRLETYWVRFKKFLTSVTISDLEQYPVEAFMFQGERLGITRKNVNPKLEARILHLKSKIEEYQSDFYQCLQDLNEDFVATHELDLFNIIHQFKQLANLLCLNDGNVATRLPPVNFRVESQRGRLYSEYIREIRKTGYTPFILPNDTGLFGLNSYLYCFFERIILVGIPDQPARFDLRYDCPGLFVIHDFAHMELTANIDLVRKENNLDSYLELKPLYSKIITNPSFTKLDKELCVLNMWSIIHEFSVFPEIPDGFTIDYNTAPSDFILIIIENVFITLMEEFFSEYRRFTDLIMNSDYISTLKSVLELLPTKEIEDSLNMTYRKLSPYVDDSLSLQSVTIFDLILAVESNANVEDPVLNRIALHLITQWAGWNHIKNL